MSEPDDDMRETIGRLFDHLTPDERAQLRRELIRYANQDSTVLPQGFVQLVHVARARGFRPA